MLLRINYLKYQKIILNLSSTKLLPRFFSNLKISPPRKSLDVNTNLLKDVIIYKNGNDRLFKYLNLFGLSQLFLWTFMSSNIFEMKEIKREEIEKSEDTPWYLNFKVADGKYKNVLGGFFIMIGFSSFMGCSMYTLRAVRYLILHKGGKDLSIVTFTPFGANRIMKVPLSDVSCRVGRGGSETALALSVKRRRIPYMIDNKGEFRNTQLFDSTVGLYKGF